MTLEFHIFVDFFYLSRSIDKHSCAQYAHEFLPIALTFAPHAQSFDQLALCISQQWEV